MLFHSFSFLLFFPLVTGMYFLIPKRAKQLWLLVASYYFYMSWNVQYGCLILLVTAIGYGGGLLLAQNKVRQGKRRLAVLTGSVLLCVGILFFFQIFCFCSAEYQRIAPCGGKRASVKGAGSHSSGRNIFLHVPDHRVPD